MSQIAKSMQEWFQSVTGREAADFSTLSEPGFTKVHLANRLEAAFLDGYHAAEKNIVEHANAKIKEFVREASQ